MPESYQSQIQFLLTRTGIFDKLVGLLINWSWSSGWALNGGKYYVSHIKREGGWGKFVVSILWEVFPVPHSIMGFVVFCHIIDGSLLYVVRLVHDNVSKISVYHLHWLLTLCLAIIMFYYKLSPQYKLGLTNFFHLIDLQYSKRIPPWIFGLHFMFFFVWLSWQIGIVDCVILQDAKVSRLKYQL